MAPTTRSVCRDTPPIYNPRGTDADTIKKTRFFDAYDSRDPNESLRSIAAQNKTTSPTARRWLKQREIEGTRAYRSTRKRSEILGKRSRISKEQCQILVSPSRNPVRNQLYEAQIEYHQLPVKKRALQSALKKHTNGAQRRRQAYIQKEISSGNKKLREQFGNRHQDKGVDSYWKYVVFTDEFHLDPAAQAIGYILRENGTRYNTENIQERPQLEGVKLHVAGWVNWHSKCKKLEFYKDEKDENEGIIKPRLPPKPRKSKYESESEYNTRLLTWQASKPHNKEVKTTGNAMTQKYYSDRLLPVYINAVNTLRIQEPNLPHSWLLQEDGDPSHGLRKEGLAYRLKKANWITNHSHPPQSPDLNPIEACWNILKQRVRKRTWNTIAELREIIQDEWDKITMQEIRDRISDMPRRCKLLAKTGGAPIKSAQW
jgi:hypothetical protein